MIDFVLKTISLISLHALNLINATESLVILIRPHQVPIKKKLSSLHGTIMRWIISHHSRARHWPSVRYAIVLKNEWLGIGHRAFIRPRIREDSASRVLMMGYVTQRIHWSEASHKNVTGPRLVARCRIPIRRVLWSVYVHLLPPSHFTSSSWSWLGGERDWQRENLPACTQGYMYLYVVLHYKSIMCIINIFT